MFEETTYTLATVKSTGALLKKKFLTAKRPGTDVLTAVKVSAQSGLQALQIAVQSSGGAYAYPVKGMVYLTQHPENLKPVFSSLLMLGAASVAVVVLLFIFTYVPQLGILVFVTGPLAPIVAFFLVLAESFFIIMFLSRAWMEPMQDDVFDSVLVQNGFESLVARGRDVHPSSRGKTVVERLGKRAYKGLQKFTPEAFLQYLITLPLNFIPVVGTLFFLVINGTKNAMGLHGRYFQLKGFTPEQQKAYVEERRGAYMGFGVVSLALAMVPFAAPIFAFTNTVGAAVWACEMEKKSAAKPVAGGSAAGTGAEQQLDDFKAAQKEATKEWKRIDA